MNKEKEALKEILKDAEKRVKLAKITDERRQCKESLDNVMIAEDWLSVVLSAIRGWNIDLK
jgi:hypothetical protein